MHKNAKKYLEGQNGNIAVIVAVSLAGLLGFSAFALDLGVSYNRASKLQNALDSAVLAAVHELPANSKFSSEWSAAENEAMKYASANGFDLYAGDIDPIYKDDVPANEIIGIRVTKTIEVEYNFAKVLGMDKGTVSRSAAAGLSPAGGIRNAVPLSVTSSSLSLAIAADAVEDLIIKCSSNTDEVGIDCTGVSGWFAPLRFDGAGASSYSNLIAFGYDGELYIGQMLDIEKGNMSGPTLSGFTVRYGSCTDGCTSESFEPDCPRLIHIPVISIISKSKVRVDAFAAFFITGCGGNGNNSYIKATYIPDTVLPDAVAGASGQDYGLYVIKLLS